MEIDCLHVHVLHVHADYVYYTNDNFDWRIFNQRFSRKLPHDIQRIALRKLIMIDNAKTIEDLRVPPANRLEKLEGERNGQYIIRINDQWRICFYYKDGDFSEVEIVDYH